MIAPGRYVFLDLFRGIVVFLMLEGHFVRHVLEDAAREAAWWPLHEILHGMTAPAFLFGAGFTFAIATDRKQHLLRTWGWPVLRRFWRAVVLVIIGYGLHLPYYSLRKTVEETTADQLIVFLQFDVLQLIGFGLIFLRLLYMAVKDEDRFLLASAGVAFAVVFLTPFVWSPAVVRDMPVWLGTSLTGAYGSPFPLFPYLAFLCAGMVTSWGFLRFARDGRETTYMVRLLAGGALLMAGGWLIDLLPVRIYKDAHFWFTSPSYFWMRLGLLCILLPVLWYAMERLPADGLRRIVAPRWLIVLGIESLFVYVAHLMVVYGSVINADSNVGGLLGTSVPLPQTLAWCTAFIAVFALAALGWNKLKKKHAPMMRVVFVWITLVWIGEFILRPW